MNRGMLAAVAALAAGLLFAPGALASTVSVTGGNTLRVAETGNEANTIGIRFDSGTGIYTVNDATANLNPIAPCSMANAHTATCPGAAITGISVDTGDRNDSITLDPTVLGITQDLDGGSGNDSVHGDSSERQLSPGTLRGGSGNDLITGMGTLLGGSGNDAISGSPFADTLRGSTGKDLLNGGNGPDDIAGGGSTDTLLYPPDRVTPINVTIGSGSGNDGGIEDVAPFGVPASAVPAAVHTQASGGRDTVHGDIEAVVGTAAGDTLIGDKSAEVLFGMGGNDLLLGNGGNDLLGGFAGDDLMFGGHGRDTLRGSFGNDRLSGGSGDDRLAGGPDNDFLKGKHGSDVMKGKTGIDTIRAHDGTRDVKISCGPGQNRLESAKRDRHLDPRAKSC